MNCMEREVGMKRGRERKQGRDRRWDWSREDRRGVKRKRGTAYLTAKWYITTLHSLSPFV